MSPTKTAALEAMRRSLRRAGLSPATERAYVFEAKRFLRWLGKRRLPGVVREHVRRFLAELSPTCRGSALAHALAAIRALFLANGREEEALPTEGFDHDRSPTKPPVLLTPEAVRRLLVAALEGSRGRGWRGLRAAFALRDRACLELVYALGLRASEARAARVADLDLAAGTLLVRPAKRGPVRSLPLPATAVEHLARYVREGRPVLAARSLDDHGALLLNRYGGPFAASGVWILIARLSRLAGVRVHPHALRRGIATHLVRAGVSVPAVSSLLGHRRLSTTARYVTVDLEDLRRAVSKLERPKG